MASPARVVVIEQFALSGASQSLSAALSKAFDGANSIAIKNLTGNATVTINDTAQAVTAANGFPIEAGVTVSLDVQSTDSINIIGTAAQRVAILATKTE